MIRSHQQTIGALPDCQKELKGWKDKFEMDLLTQLDLIQFFQRISPYFLTIEPKDDPSELGCCTFDEAGAKVAIIDVLEELICGDNPQLVLEKIKTEDNVPSVCGRVFKIGEPTYSCRECSMDPTCVLCASCFNKSTHRHHKYKMSTSSGGGCCDCGDNEAWKREPYCEEHKLGIGKQGESKIVTDRMKKICQIAFRSILSFCIKTFQVKGENLNPSDYEGDIFCTILYNDEVHTFEQVISTLTNIIKCNHKEAIDYVTAIDREGRAVVKCATNALCKKMQHEIERKPVRTLTNAKNAPLKVDVLHKDVVACQYVSMYLLSWFQDFLTKHQAFRAIFYEIITESGNPYSLKNILLNDINLWKEARTSWHRLLISGMLMEYENKKKLAVVFTQKYPQLQQDFIGDDHFHTFSVVSLSVQLYTVPTVAHHLIAEEDAFFKLLHTFYTEMIEKHVKNHVLQFEKNTSSQTVFRRAVFILIDLKYLLSFKPDTWTQELRMGFLHGVQQLIKFLKVMQGMDAVTRQVGQHIEYEPEWESAFTLHIKLSNIITLVLDWCSTDHTVLVKVYRMVIAALLENKFIVSQTKTEVRELADHSASCLQYDVLSKPVSIHLPLTRFLAGLYINFEKFGLNFDMVAGNADKPTPEQIIEPVLCARTMISQVISGMWRRNGYSLINQLFFYRNVRCRAEMLDRDVIILQMGASLIESNEFLIHVLNKFNLLAWASPNYVPNTSGGEEDGVRQIAYMIDEFLELLIIVIGERYTPGIGCITEEDRLKKEIIQQLCIKPFLHSELIKSLNEDAHGETGMENVINDVAIFKKEKKGVYQLKDEYFDDYNMYFYHYSREEKSKSEEAQQKRRQEKNELVCCPPPKLPKLTQSFSMLANILQCDVMLHCMHTVLKRALDLTAITFLESQLAKTLHLMGYALQEEESGNYPFLIFLERSSNWGLLPLLEELAKSPRVESQHDFIVWVIKKFKELKQRKTDEEMQPEPETETMQSESQQSAAIAEQAQKEKRARLAAKRRAQILAQMANAQKTFMEGNADLFKEANDDSMRASTSSAGAMEWQAIDMAEEEENTKKVENCCLGPNRKIVRLEDNTYTCILCSEDAVVSRYGPSMVYPAFIQKSSVLSRYQKTNDGVLQYLETTIHPSPHTTTCGHVMHIYCFKQYFENEKSKESRRPYRNRTPMLFDVEKNEFLCPLCRFLSNSVLPLVPALPTLNEGPNDLKRALDSLDFNTWLEIMDDFTAQLPLEYPLDGDFKKEVTRTCNELYESKFIKVINEKFNLNIEMDKIGAEKHLNSIFGETTEENVNNFVNSIKTISPYHAQAPGIEQFLVTWLSCGYTIESLEMLLRATDKPLKGEMSIRYTSSLSGLVRVSGIICANNTRANIEMISHLKSVYDILLARKSACVLEWDLFGMMVMLIFTTRSVLGAGWGETSIPKGERVDHSIVKGIFLATILRILITYELSNDMNVDNFMDEDFKSVPEHEKLLSFYHNYNIYLDENVTTTHNVTTKTLIEQIKLQCHTFLRCSCLLFNFMTDVELPDELQYLGRDTFEVMTSYLGLSSDVTSYFDDPVAVSFMTRLAEHPDIIEFKRKILDRRTDEIIPIVSPVTPIRQLITLPDDYIDVINSVSLFTCPNNEKEESRNPTMCLVCGEILCSQTYCCQKDIVVQDAIRKDKQETIQVGACTYHMHSCGAGIGIFLRIREAEILLLGPNKGSYISAPYLDDYGETDEGLRRGNPLHLCQERYRKLHLMWLSHGIHEEIVRRTEFGQNQYATQWQNL